MPFINQKLEELTKMSLTNYQDQLSMLWKLQKKEDAAPAIKFNHQAMTATINGQPIDYEKQILTEKGLEINVDRPGESPNEQDRKIVVAFRKAVQFDTRLNENTYCLELARTIDRATNTAFHALRKSRISGSAPSANSYTFEICEIMVRKIPLKPRCFETVFTNVSTLKIKLLLENDRFCGQVLGFMFRLLFKIHVQEFIKLEKKIIENSEQQLSNTNQDQKYPKPNQQAGQKSQKLEKTTKKRHHNHTHNPKAIQLYNDTKQKLKDSKLSYQRVNILLTLFTRQNRLYNFLYELNKKFVHEQLFNGLPKILNPEKDSTEPQQYNTLTKLIHIIRTIRVSLGKAQTSNESIRQLLLSSSYLTQWLHKNIPSIHNSPRTSNKLLQFLSLLSEAYPQFLTTLYVAHQNILNSLLQAQIHELYLTLNSYFPTEEQTKEKHEYATLVLDCLGVLCRAMVRDTANAPNIGRTVCRYLCDSATRLRTCDIQMLTYVCCVNSHSRAPLLKYLFQHFRRFISNVKAGLTGSYRDSVTTAKKNRHHLLQIMQSIRRISQIDSIDLAVDAELVEDIDYIIETSKGKIRDKLTGTREDKNIQEGHWKRGDCVRSAYWAMVKTVNVEKGGENYNDELD